MTTVRIWTCEQGHPQAIADAEVDVLRESYGETPLCGICAAKLVTPVREGGTDVLAVGTAHVRLQAVRARYSADHPRPITPKDEL